MYHAMALSLGARRASRLGPFGAVVRRLVGMPPRPAANRRGVPAASLEQQVAWIEAELAVAGRAELAPTLRELPRHFLLARPAESIAAHLVLAAEPVAAGQVRTRTRETERAGVWELLVVARDRPGLLATMAGVLALRGVDVLAADAATRDDGTALDAFTVRTTGEASPWTALAADLADALSGRRPVDERIAEHHADGPPPESAPVVSIREGDPRYTVFEVRGPDRLGLLYRVTRALYELRLDVHYAEIETLGAEVLDRFYVRDLAGERLDPARAKIAADTVGQQLAAWFGVAAGAPRSRS